MQFTNTVHYNADHAGDCDISLPRMGRLRGIEVVSDQKITRIRLVANACLTLFNYEGLALKSFFNATHQKYQIRVGINYDEATVLQALYANVSAIVFIEEKGFVDIICDLYFEQDPNSRINYRHADLFNL